MAKKKASSGKKLGVLGIIILVLNGLAILALLLSYLSVHISPAKNWILPFFGLANPYFLLVNIAFIIYWGIRRKWWIILSIIAILLGWNHLGRLFRISGDSNFEEGTTYLKITSYNVKNLSNDNVDLVNTDIRDNIINYLDQTGSDIICLQELMIVHPDPDAFIDSISDILGLPYHHYARYYEKKARSIDAIFTFSRFPIVKTGQVEAEARHNYALFTDLLIGRDTIRLYNIHLESIRLRHEDYSFISGLDLQFEEDENIREGSLRIIRKLKSAFEKRSFQADNLVASLEGSPYPVILCGDFNDTPNSYVYQELSKGMKDAFKESGRGFGNTYLGKVPSFRIDFILYDDHFVSSDFRRNLVRFSDHFPVSCYLGWKDMQGSID